MKKNLVIALLGVLFAGAPRAALAGPIPPAGCPSCVQNSASPQNAQINIGTATVRGTLTATTGTFINFSASNLSVTSVTGNGAGIVGLDASNLASGVVPTGVMSGAYAGITGLGTITSGVWNGSLIGSASGGTGANLSAAPQGAVFYFGATGTGAALSPASSGVLVTNGASANPSWSTAPTIAGTNITGIPLTAINAGTLPSSIGVTDASIVSVSGSKVTGNISGAASGITGTVSIAQIVPGTLPTSIPASSVTASGVPAGTYGSSSDYTQFTVGSDGRLTAAAEGAIALAPSQINAGTLPSGVAVPATNVQSGTLGSGVVAQSVAASGVSAGSYGSNSSTLLVTLGADGRATAASAVPISLPVSAIQSGTLPSSVLVPAVNVQAGTLGGGVVAQSVAASGVASGTYGSGTFVPQLTIGADGRVTAAAQIPVITYPAGSVGGDLSGTLPNPYVVQASSGTGFDVLYNLMIGQGAYISTVTAYGIANFAGSVSAPAIYAGSGVAVSTMTPSGLFTGTGNFSGAVAAQSFAGPLTGNVTGNVSGNVSGTAANVTGVVAVANGGTGATTAAGAVANIVNGQSISPLNLSVSSVTKLGGYFDPLAYGSVSTTTVDAYGDILMDSLAGNYLQWGVSGSTSSLDSTGSINLGTGNINMGTGQVLLGYPDNTTLGVGGITLNTGSLGSTYINVQSAGGLPALTLGEQGGVAPTGDFMLASTVGIGISANDSSNGFDLEVDSATGNVGFGRGVYGASHAGALNTVDVAGTLWAESFNVAASNNYGPSQTGTGPALSSLRSATLTGMAPYVQLAGVGQPLLLTAQSGSAYNASVYIDSTTHNVGITNGRGAFKPATPPVAPLSLVGDMAVSSATASAPTVYISSAGTISASGAVYASDGAGNVSTMTPTGIASSSGTFGPAHTAVAPLDVNAAQVYPSVGARFSYNGGQALYWSPDLANSDTGLVVGNPTSFGIDANNFYFRSGTYWNGTSFGGTGHTALGIDPAGNVGINSANNAGVNNYPATFLCSSCTMLLDGNTGGISVTAPGGISSTYGVTAATGSFSTQVTVGSSGLVLAPTVLAITPSDYYDGTDLISSYNGYFKFGNNSNYGAGGVEIFSGSPVTSQVQIKPVSMTFFSPIYYFNSGDVGISSSTPSYQFTVGSSTGDAIDVYGHELSYGPAPVLSSCGTSPSIHGTDRTGAITLGTSATGCVMTFVAPYPTGSQVSCTATTNSTTIPAALTSASTSAVTFSLSAAITGGVIYYNCGASL